MCCRHNFIVAVLVYLRFTDIKTLFYADVGEITPITLYWGDLGSFAITCITDAF